MTIFGLKENVNLVTMNKIIEIPRIGFDPEKGSEGRSVQEMLDEFHEKVDYLWQMHVKRTNMRKLENSMIIKKVKLLERK